MGQKKKKKAKKKETHFIPYKSPSLRSSVASTEQSTLYPSGILL
jgi:hypothetical protein